MSDRPQWYVWDADQYGRRPLSSGYDHAGKWIAASTMEDAVRIFMGLRPYSGRVYGVHGSDLTARFFRAVITLKEEP